MKIVGLTGGIACGKSTLAQMFRDLGAYVIDADKVSHELTQPGGEALPAIREAFGGYVFSPDGTLNRDTLSAIVFSDEAQRKKLNALLHPMIEKRMRKDIEICRKMGELIVIMDVPLLFEVGIDSLADVTICASAPLDTQLERMRTRSGLDWEQAMRRINSQIPLNEKEKLADVVLHTDCSEEELRRRTRELYDAWLEDNA